MKKCPYCAEEIQDEAIKCRYCHSDLSVPPPSVSNAPSVSNPPAATPAETTSPQPVAAPAQAASPVDAGSVRYTHSGYQYVLGYGADFFGVWDRQAPSLPAERFPRTDDGWRQAWTRFVGLEPNHVAVPAGGGAPSTGGGTPPSIAPGPTGDDHEAVQYTHSGQRYLLGYGTAFFGIWDRQSPTAPVEKFPRDDAGWAAAWRRFTQIETHFTEVSLGSQSGPHRS